MKTLYSTVSKRLIKLFTTSSDRKVAGLTSSSCHEFQLRQISFTATNSSTTFQTFSLLPCCYDRKHDSSHSPARKEMPTFFPSGHPRVKRDCKGTKRKFAVWPISSMARAKLQLRTYSFCRCLKRWR